MDKYALLHRLNPKHWPDWDQHMPLGRESDIWFKTGRRKTEDIHPGIPVFVLGTGKLGVVAKGKTISGVEYCPDPMWMLAPESEQAAYKEAENRVRDRLQRIHIPIDSIKSNIILSSLPNIARETTTWLNKEKYNELAKLVRK